MRRRREMRDMFQKNYQIESHASLILSKIRAALLQESLLFQDYSFIYLSSWVSLLINLECMLS